MLPRLKKNKSFIKAKKVYYVLLKILVSFLSFDTRQGISSRFIASNNGGSAIKNSGVVDWSDISVQHIFVTEIVACYWFSAEQIIPIYG